MKFSALKKASACRVNRENSVSVHKGDGEFAIYQEMSNRIKAYKESLTETIDEAVEKLKEWLENDFETTSKWQKKDASKKAIAKVERYLKACPEKSLPTRYLNFSFAGETYTGFRPDFVFLSEIPTPIVLRDMKVEKLPMLHLVKFSASKQKVGNGTGRALESTVSTHPFTLGAIFYAQRFFEERAVSSFYVVKVSFDALVSEQDNKDYKEFGHYFDYSENEASKDARVSTYFVFNGKRLIRWGNSLNSSFSLSAHRNFFPKMIELIKGIQESEKCTQADCEKCILYNRCHYTEPPLALPEKAERTITVEDIKLSEEQERIVNAKTGIFRVLATAGSGKTFCMVLRIIKLIEDGVDPTAMLLISFSNIAVEELRSRIEKMLKVYGYDEFVDVNDFTIVTFNSLGSQLISEYFEMLGFEKKPELIDNIEQYDIVNEVVKESEEKIVGLDYENPYLKFGSNTVGIIAKLSNLFDEIKREKIETFADYDKYLGLTDKIRHCSAGAETVAAQEKREKYRQIFKEFEKYSEKLKNADIVDYADQSIYVDELIRRSFEDGIDYIIDAFEFEHIVVDEFQDSNEFQLRFVKALMGHMKFKSLMVVGDDSQAIYGFNHTSRRTSSTSIRSSE